jgi:hypothetical protein
MWVVYGTNVALMQCPAIRKSRTNQNSATHLLGLACMHQPATEPIIMLRLLRSRATTSPRFPSVRIVLNGSPDPLFVRPPCAREKIQRARMSERLDDAPDISILLSFYLFDDSCSRIHLGRCFTQQDEVRARTQSALFVDITDHPVRYMLFELGPSRLPPMLLH